MLHLTVDLERWADVHLLGPRQVQSCLFEGLTTEARQWTFIHAQSTGDQVVPKSGVGGLACRALGHPHQCFCLAVRSNPGVQVNGLRVTAPEPRRCPFHATHAQHARPIQNFDPFVAPILQHALRGKGPVNLMKPIVDVWHVQADSMTRCPYRGNSLRQQSVGALLRNPAKAVPVERNGHKHGRTCAVH